MLGASASDHQVVTRLSQLSQLRAPISRPMAAVTVTVSNPVPEPVGAGAVRRTRRGRPRRVDAEVVRKLNVERRRPSIYYQNKMIRLGPSGDSVITLIIYLMPRHMF